MPFIVLAIGVFIAIVAGLKFFTSASPKQIKKFVLVIIAILYALILMFFALSGRIIIALIGVIIALPLVALYFKKMQKTTENKNRDDNTGE